VICGPEPASDGALDARVTLRAIVAAASARRCLSYGDVATANGLPWSQARRRMDPHLFALCRAATAAGRPLPSAIVVDALSRAHGRMTGRPLIGFVRCAERC